VFGRRDHELRERFVSGRSETLPAINTYRNMLPWYLIHSFARPVTMARVSPSAMVLAGTLLTKRWFLI
jgi:hypothetical protein